MATFQSKATFEAPIEKVYDLMADITKAPNWITGLQKIEPLSGTPGQAGFEARYIFEENGKTVLFQEKVTKVDPYKYMAFQLEGPNINMQTEAHFKNLGDRTEVLYVNKAKGSNLGMKIFLPLLKSMMKKRQQADFEKFRSLL